MCFILAAFDLHSFSSALNQEVSNQLILSVARLAVITCMGWRRGDFEGQSICALERITIPNEEAARLFIL